MSARRKHHFRAAGVSFVPTYPRNLLALREPVEIAASHGESLPAILRRNPANPHDANAVEVHVPALGDHGMVGHVPADIAARIAPHMDLGVEIAAEVWAVAIDPNHQDRPGIEIAAWAVERSA